MRIKRRTLAALLQEALPTQWIWMEGGGWFYATDEEPDRRILKITGGSILREPELER